MKNTILVTDHHCILFEDAEGTKLTEPQVTSFDASSSKRNIPSYAEKYKLIGKGRMKSIKLNGTTKHINGVTDLYFFKQTND